jgi:polyisoprenoid-binding protein YceI
MVRRPRSNTGRFAARFASRAAFGGAAAVVLGAAGSALAALGSPTDAHVGFLAAGPAGMKIEGTTTDLTVADDGTNVTIDVPLANLSTGISLRDHHMKEKYLEVGKYASTTLVVARAALKFPAPGASFEGDAPGTLKLHGQARPVTFHYDAKGDGGGFAVHGRLHVNMNDYGITVPVYLGVTVKPDVDVTASFHVAGG